MADQELRRDSLPRCGQASLSQRLGLIRRQPDRSVTIWVEDETLLSSALTIANGIRERFPRTPVLFVRAAGDGAPAGFTSFGKPLSLALGLFFKRLRTQTLIVAGVPSAHVLNPLPAAHARGASLILLRMDERAAADRALLDGIVEAGSVVAPETIAMLDRLITRSRKQTMAARGRLPLESRLLRQPMLHALLKWKFRGYRSIDDLREALGHPSTILCLGNGPSSELPELAGLPHDRLFRVNMSWQTRGLLAAPDLVFTGLAEAVAALRPAAGFMFGTIRSEEKILGNLLLSLRRLRYATAERLGIFDRNDEAGVAPTNGALMLATAVALQPKRLVIAGIDLYTHPAGAYPGDTVTVNAYAAGHDAALELRFIVDALARYQGQLIILSDALRLACGVKPA